MFGRSVAIRRVHRAIFRGPNIPSSEDVRFRNLFMFGDISLEDCGRSFGRNVESDLGEVFLVQIGPILLLSTSGLGRSDPNGSTTRKLT